MATKHNEFGRVAMLLAAAILFVASLLLAASDALAETDTTPPAPPVIWGYGFTDGAFWVAGTASEDGTINLFEGQNNVGTTTTIAEDCPAGCIYFWSISVPGVSEGTHTYYATATDTAGNVSDPSNTVTVVVSADTTPPDTSITSGPNGPTNDSTPTFSFIGSDDLSPEANLLYSYKVDNEGWSNYSSGTSVTLGGASGLSQGAHTFYVKSRDEAGNEDLSPAQQSFTVDSLAPTGSVIINDGAKRTSSQSVTLTLSASDPSPGSGVTQMRISNTQSELTSASWEAYATTKSWTLSSGTGTKTVYVQYRDAAGNISAVVQDTITFKP